MLYRAVSSCDLAHVSQSREPARHSLIWPNAVICDAMTGTGSRWIQMTLASGYVSNITASRRVCHPLRTQYLWGRVYCTCCSIMRWIPYCTP